jgi:serine protease Do
MDDMMILDAVERYIRGEMNPDERLHFENLRKTNAEVDQLVVEHTLFMQQMNRFGEWQKFRTRLNEVHTNLAEEGKIDSGKLKGKAKVVYLWNRYKRVAAIAASIAGVTAITLSALVWSISPKTPVSEVEHLKTQIEDVKKVAARNDREIKDLQKGKSFVEIPRTPIVYTTGGTGFILDARGYLVTNAHVVEGAKYVAVQNHKGEFPAKVVHVDAARDLAILKITDKDFKPYTTIPYSLSKTPADLAEPIFTLGYPRNDIVYGQGYLSSKTGYKGDTLSCQIDIVANRGNSGSPIFNKNGEIIGILNGRQTNVEGFAFAIQSKYIYTIIEDLKKKNAVPKLKLSTRSTLAGSDRTVQVKKLEDYVFMVKVN